MKKLMSEINGKANDTKIFLIGNLPEENMGTMKEPECLDDELVFLINVMESTLQCTTQINNILRGEKK